MEKKLFGRIEKRLGGEKRKMVIDRIREYQNYF